MIKVSSYWLGVSATYLVLSFAFPSSSLFSIALRVPVALFMLCAVSDPRDFISFRKRNSGQGLQIIPKLAGQLENRASKLTRN
jgi:hypothetical protein